MEFMGDGIFVAHNVSFDYGFIANEFDRVGRRFRFPKLCTCAGVRGAIRDTSLTDSGSFARSTELSFRITIERSAMQGPRRSC
jgi:DNA polymerase III epsilon subunit-like protein